MNIEQLTKRVREQVQEFSRVAWPNDSIMMLDMERALVINASHRPGMKHYTLLGPEDADWWISVEHGFLIPKGGTSKVVEGYGMTEEQACIVVVEKFYQAIATFTEKQIEIAERAHRVALAGGTVAKIGVPTLKGNVP